MKSLRLAGAAASCCFALSGTLGCAEETPKRGELTLALSTDLAPGKDLDGVRIRITSRGSRALDQSYDIGPEANDVKLPATLVVVAGEEANTPVDIRVFGSSGDTVRTVQRVVTTVPTAGNALLRLPVQWLCEGMIREEDGQLVSSCEGDETCVAGSCRSARVDSGELPDFDAAAVFGGGASPGDPEGTCFEVESCFGDAFRVELDEDCVASVDARASEDVNLALVTAPGGDGFCSGLRCYVVLDEDPELGFEELAPADDGLRRFALPEAACERVDDGRATAVVATLSCNAKTREIPPCGAASSVGEARGAPPDDCPGFRAGGELGTLVDDPLTNRYLEAASELEAAAEERKTELAQHCLELSLALDGPEIDLGEPPSDAELEEVCNDALARYEASPARADFAIATPHCLAAVDDQLDCEYACLADADANIRGRCSKPAGDCAGACSGECQATLGAPSNCDGECEGLCIGDCDGECLGVWGARGEAACGASCIGACTGTCAGTCGSTVDGACAGMCVATSDADEACDEWAEEPGCAVPLAASGSDRACSAVCRSTAGLEPICTTGGLETDGNYVGVLAAVTPIFEARPRVELLLASARALAELEGAGVDALSAACIEAAEAASLEAERTLDTALAVSNAIIAASR